MNKKRRKQERSLNKKIESGKNEKGGREQSERTKIER